MDPKDPKKPNAGSASIPLNEWVEKVVGNPADFEGSILLNGYLGKSADENNVILYSDIELNHGVEIKKEDILFVQKTNADTDLPGSRLWVKKNAEYEHGTTDAEGNKSKAKFLDGDIYENYVKSLGPKTVFCPTLPLCPSQLRCPTQLHVNTCSPATVCPVLSHNPCPTVQFCPITATGPCPTQICPQTLDCSAEPMDASFEAKGTLIINTCSPVACPIRTTPFTCLPGCNVLHTVIPVRCSFPTVKPSTCIPRICGWHGCFIRTRIGPPGCHGVTLIDPTWKPDFGTVFHKAMPDTHMMGCPNTSTCTPHTGMLGCPDTSTCTPVTLDPGCPDTSTCTPHTHMLGCPNTSTCTPHTAMLGCPNSSTCTPQDMAMAAPYTSAMGCPNTSTCTPQTHMLGCPATSTCTPHTLLGCPRTSTCPPTYAPGCPDTSTCAPQDMGIVLTSARGCPNSSTCTPSTFMLGCPATSTCTPPTLMLGCPNTSTCTPQTLLGCPRTSTCPPTYAPGCPDTSTCPPQDTVVAPITAAFSCPSTSTCTPQTHMLGCPVTSTCAPATRLLGCPATSTCPPHSAIHACRTWICPPTLPPACHVTWVPNVC